MSKVEDYNYIESMKILFSGMDKTLLLVKTDKNDYLNYKNGVIDSLTLGREKEMKILSLLDELGYPMDEIGTYLYKNMIVKITNHLEGVSKRQDIIDCKNLVHNLKDAYSSFYREVARFDLDLGVKSFHKYVEDAIEKVDYSKANPIVLYEIYGKFNESLDYGENAFVIGSYLTGFLTPRQVEVPKIKKLANMSDVSLKYKF